MISCHKFSIYISEYIDGELTQEIREEIHEHITYCPECRSLHHAFSRLLTFCHHCCSLEVPENTHNELMHALENVISVKKVPLRKKRKISKRRHN